METFYQKSQEVFQTALDRKMQATARQNKT
jgi:hypothetical protein